MFSAILSRVELLEAHARNLRSQRRLVTAERVEAKIERLIELTDDPAALPTLLVPDGGESFTTLPTPTPGHLAAWLFQTPAPIRNDHLDALLDPDQRRQLETRMTLLSRYGPAKRARLASSDVRASATARQAHELLTEMLEQGLRRRIGLPLLGFELVVYQYVIALGYETKRLRVCEGCCRVFGAPRAWHCPRCTHSPVRTNPRPWHIAVRAADRAAGTRTANATIRSDAGSTLIVATSRRRAPATTTYLARCQGCDATFTAHEARTRYCSTCGAPAARTARSRARHRPA